MIKVNYDEKTGKVIGVGHADAAGDLVEGFSGIK